MADLGAERIGGRWAGLLMVLAGVALWATMSTAIRGVDADGAAILFCRGVSGGVVASCLLLARNRRATITYVRGMGHAGILVIAWSVLGTGTFTLALQMSTAADVAAIYATLPFVAAGLAWLLWREQTDRLTLLAACCAVGGSLITLHGALGGGSVLGHVLAVGCALCYGAQVVLLERNPHIPVLPLVGATSLIVGAITAPIAQFGTVSPFEAAVLVGSGVLQGVLPDWLFMRGAQRLPPAQAALISTLEAPIATASAWLVIGEHPAQTTLIGGGLTVAAVAVRQLVKDQDSRRNDPGAGMPLPPILAPVPDQRPG